MPLFCAPSSKSLKSPVDEVVHALQTLQSVLPDLDPVQAAELRQALPFATEEWQQGLAMTIAPQERAVNTSDIAPVLNSNALHGVEDARTLLTPDSTKLIPSCRIPSCCIASHRIVSHPI